MNFIFHFEPVKKASISYLQTSLFSPFFVLSRILNISKKHSCIHRKKNQYEHFLKYVFIRDMDSILKPQR